MRDDLAGHSTDMISLENVQTYIDFLVRSNYPALRLLGGEPTIHPQFTDIVDMGLQAGRNIVVFTNALWSNRVLEYLAQDRTRANVKFVVNIHEKKNRHGNETDRVEKSLAVGGGRTMLGFNIYQRFFNLRFVIDLINRFKLQRKVRLGLSSPIAGKSNAFLQGKELYAIGERLLDQLEILEQNDILAEFDCGWQLCMFQEKRYGTLFKATNNFNASCISIIDVGPDLTAWPCFPLSGLLNVKLTDFQNREELIRYYDSTLPFLRRLGSTDNCTDCKYGRRDQCSGGCMARSIRDFMEADNDFAAKLERNVERASGRSA